MSPEHNVHVHAYCQERKPTGLRKQRNTAVEMLLQHLLHDSDSTEDTIKVHYLNYNTIFCLILLRELCSINYIPEQTGNKTSIWIDQQLISWHQFHETLLVSPPHTKQINEMFRFTWWYNSTVAFVSGLTTLIVTVQYWHCRVTKHCIQISGYRFDQVHLRSILLCHLPCVTLLQVVSALLCLLPFDYFLQDNRQPLRLPPPIEKGLYTRLQPLMLSRSVKATNVSYLTRISVDLNFTPDKHKPGNIIQTGSLEQVKYETKIISKQLWL